MVLFSIRSCINCGSWSVQKNYFCSECSEVLLEKMRLPKSLYFENMKIQALFRWVPGQSDSLSQLLLELKDAEIATWEYYAYRFLENTPVVSDKVVFVSSMSNSKKKHAQNWGNSLAKIAGRPHVVGLKLKEIDSQSTQQKDLSKWARKSREFEKIADISTESQDLIFVDDVVTTGATALAAYRALGRPRKFQVWCLASRELSSIASHEGSW